MYVCVYARCVKPHQSQRLRINARHCPLEGFYVAKHTQILLELPSDSSYLKLTMILRARQFHLFYQEKEK